MRGLRIGCVRKIKDVFLDIKKSKLNLTMLGMAGLTVLITSLIFGLFIYAYAAIKTQENSEKLLSDLITQCGMNMETNVNELERISFKIINENAVKLLRGGMSPAKTFTTLRDTQDRITEYTGLHTGIVGIYLYARDGQVYSGRMSSALKDGYSIINQQWYAPYYDQTRFRMIYYQNDDQFLLPKGLPRISLVKNIFDYASVQKLGAMEIVLDWKKFEKAVTSKNDANAGLYIIDSLGRLAISGQETDAGYRQALLSAAESIAARTDDSAQFDLTSGGKSYRAVYYRSVYTGMTVFAVRPASLTAIMDAGFLAILFVSALCLSIIAASATASLASARIFKPLRDLQETMRKVSLENIGERACVKRVDEIGEVAVNFNRTVDALSEQMRVNIELEHERERLIIEYSQCELDALQSQINPHFLYNALEAISMTARVNDDIPAHKMAIALGRLLRASIPNGRRFVSLGDELDHVKLYVESQRLLFKKGIDLDTSAAARFSQAEVVRLILQPMAENAVRHAFNSDARARLIISAETDGETLEIFIEDNGNGMPADQMARINDSLAKYAGVGETRSIGLANTNKRIELAYGSRNYGVRIVKSDDTGTIVRVTLPWEVK